MKIFESNIEILKRSSPAKLSKRFVCCVIDMIIVMFVAALIFSGLFQVIKNSASYKQASKTVTEEIKYYEEFTEETHLVEYVDGKRVNEDVIILKNVCRAIVLSYNVFGNNQQSDFVFDSNHDVIKNGAASFENDTIAYFYTQYAKDYADIIGGNINVDSGYIFEIYKNAFGSDATFIFTFDASVNEMPVLNTQVAYYLFYYLFVDETDVIGQTGKTYYNAFYTAYRNMLNDAEVKLINSEPYYSTHYLKYTTAYCDQARYSNIGLVVSIIIACFIVLLIPKYLFKNERTIGYKLFGLGVINLNDEANKWYVPLIKTIFESLGFLVITIMLYLFPPFNGVFDAMFIPIYNGSSITLGTIVLIFGLLGLMVNIFGLFTYYRQNLLNMLFKDVVVDIHYIDPGKDSEFDGRSY